MLANFRKMLTRKNVGNTLKKCWQKNVRNISEKCWWKNYDNSSKSYLIKKVKTLVAFWDLNLLSGLFESSLAL
jgi:hypothetical protein